MKKLFLGLGIVLILFSVFSFGQYIMDYKDLSAYGKGYIWGKGIILAAGLILLYFGLKKKV
jgi:hypothetical protein